MVKVRKMEKGAIGLFSLAVILPFIFVKYPDLYNEYKLFEKYFKGYLKAVGECFIPIIDGRWDRSIFEWGEIISYSKDYGHHAASRKFFAKKDGKQKYLSPNYIKQKDKAIDKSYSVLANTKKVKKCNEWLLKVRETMINDKELRKVLNKLYRQHFDEYIDEVLDRRETYSYEYYYIRHYDPGLYKAQKSDLRKGKIRKTQVSGKIECGPFKVLTTYVPSKLVIGIMINLVKFMKKLGVK
ncbi:MAG: hypothetical protein GEU26_12580 [Nitrososphaeraceae archaeon]|nr:hypothetical protein [Nitrososphaeraceae archaeon]